MAVQPEARDPRDRVIDRPPDEVSPSVGALIFVGPKTILEIGTQREKDGSYASSTLSFGWGSVQGVTVHASLDQLDRLHDLLGTYLRQQREMEAESRG